MDRDTAASLSSLCQCSASLTGEKCLPVFKGNFPFFSLGPLSLVLTLGSPEEGMAPASSASNQAFVHFEPLQASPG